jgi:hypothetical protein
LIEKALRETTSAEVQRRAEQLLKTWKTPVPSQDLLRYLRAIEVLGITGSPESKAILKELAKGPPESLVTTQARLTLRRLEPPPGGSP